MRNVFWFIILSLILRQIIALILKLKVKLDWERSLHAVKTNHFLMQLESWVVSMNTTHEINLNPQNSRVVWCLHLLGT